MNVGEQAQIYNKTLRFFCDTVGKTLAMDGYQCLRVIQGCYLLDPTSAFEDSHCNE